MAAESIKFNVIIPTRERADTLLHSLRTVVAQQYANLNIIVSDNFSQDNTKEVVAGFRDPRIRYINTGKRVSMSHNWEFALGHVDDGWVMFIGDDDGLLPWAMETLNQEIQKHKVDIVASKCGIFIWPEQFGWQKDGSLLVPLTRSSEIRNSSVELEKTFCGEQEYNQLPWLYNGGAASIDLINKLRNADGRFFCSQAPDIYSAVALTCSSDKFLYIKTPIAINGASRHSTGTSQMFSSAGIDDKPILQYFSEENIPFHEDLVLGKSLQMTLYESYLQSFHLHHGKPGIRLADQLQVALNSPQVDNFPCIEAQCLAIARKHGLPAPIRKKRSKYGIKSLLALGKNLAWEVPDPGQLGLRNIHDAVIASASIYSCMTRNILGIKLPLYWYFLSQWIRVLSPTLTRTIKKLATKFQSRNRNP